VIEVVLQENGQLERLALAAAVALRREAHPQIAGLAVLADADAGDGYAAGPEELRDLGRRAAVIAAAVAEDQHRPQRRPGALLEGLGQDLAQGGPTRRHRHGHPRRHRPAAVGKDPHLQTRRLIETLQQRRRRRTPRRHRRTHGLQARPTPRQVGDRHAGTGVQEDHRPERLAVWTALLAVRLQEEDGHQDQGRTTQECQPPDGAIPQGRLQRAVADSQEQQRQEAPAQDQDP